MSSPHPARHRNHLNSFAAFVLHRSAAVRSLAFVVVSLLALAARADTGTCSGGMAPNALNGTMGIAVNNATKDSVQAASVGFVFNGAECHCADNTLGDQPLLLDIMLTSTFPAGTTGIVQLWYGSACDVTTINRTMTTSNLCQQDTSFNLNFSNFVTGSTGSHIYVPVDAKLLFSPSSTNTHVCPSTLAQNGIFLLFFTGTMSNPSDVPYAKCVLNMTEQVQGPGAPSNLQAASGDGAVSLSWSAPSSILPPPQYYQVLCADATGNPISGSPPFDNIYSTCTPDNGLERRKLDIGGSLPAAGDGGTGTASESFGTNSLPPPAEPDAPGDGGTGDGGTDGGIGPVSSGLPPPFDFLDQKFVCSDRIPLGTGGGSVRITGLQNGKSYQFVVVGVDQYGNPTPNDNGIVDATPQPVEDLYRRYRDAGGGASGFCFIATAAYGSYQHPYVEILRQFRDEVLLPTHAGSSFVDWYYAHSPPAAEYIAAHPTARTATRIGLWPVIGFAAAWLYVPLWGKWLFVAAVAALLWRRRTMRRA
jgi:hypothetical protein